MIKYRAFYGQIKKFDVQRETESSVWMDDTRYSKLNSCSFWADTYEEAREYLLDEVDRIIENLRMELERTKGRRGQIKGMKE